MMSDTSERGHQVVTADEGVIERPRPVCAGCQLMIRERHYLSAVDAAWHTTCLVCCVCQMSLDSQPACYVKQSRIYCKHDYFRSHTATQRY